MTSVSKRVLADLGTRAWAVRELARVHGKTRVGCAALDSAGNIFGGANIEHRFRSHDIHAEVAALSCLVAAGWGELIAVFIAAERERFTPCGACLDWIFELGGEDCQIFTQRAAGEAPVGFTAAELMPYYPR